MMEAKARIADTEKPPLREKPYGSLGGVVCVVRRAFC